MSVRDNSTLKEKDGYVNVCDKCTSTTSFIVIIISISIIEQIPLFYIAESITVNWY